MSGQLRIAYLGDLWSFHHIAALQHFGEDAMYIGYASFEEVLHAVEAEKVDRGILAVENSLIGDVDDNLRQLASGRYAILGEEELHIRLHLAAREAVPLTEIHKIISHPAALLQAEQFLKSLPMVQLESVASTSSAMQLLRDANDKHVAALGNREAIEKYHLQIIAENVADDAVNFTRFFIFCKKTGNLITTKSANKASILLQTPENTGGPAMADLLLKGLEGIVLKREINSETVYIEISFTQGEQFDDSIFKLSQNGCRVQVLGKYAAAVRR
ncbi:MAG: prephenate dehydratase domain-containing protein [Chitinophagales bacterium]